MRPISHDPNDSNPGYVPVAGVISGPSGSNGKRWGVSGKQAGRSRCASAIGRHY